MGRTSDARERLLEAGSELIHERGYTAVGVGDVCAGAGVKKGSFYYFFPSKVEFALGVIERNEVESEAALDQLVHGPGAPLERLVGYAESVHQRQSGQWIKGGRILGCRFGNLALEMSTQDPALQERLRSVFNRIAGSLATVVQEAVDRGDVPPQNSEGAGRSILAFLEGKIMLAKLNNDPELLAGAGTDIVRLLGGDLNYRANTGGLEQ